MVVELACRLFVLSNRPLLLRTDSYNNILTRRKFGSGLSHNGGVIELALWHTGVYILES